MSLYELRDLRKTYDGETVLEIDDLGLEEGSVHAVVGANGAGKTTLLDILAFLSPPTSGILRFDSRPVRFRESKLVELRRQVVLVDQSPVLFTTTVSKNLALGLALRRVERRDRDARARRALEQVGLAHLAHRDATGLSGGETQRVAIARALALRPRVLLCDEPTASVDGEHRAPILDLLRRLNESEGLTIVLTTHDREQARALTDRVIVLDRGRRAFDGAIVLGARLAATDTAGQRRVDIEGLPLAVIASDRPAGPARVAIDPRAVEIHPGDAAAATPTARVVRATLEGDRVRLTVDHPTGLEIVLPLEQHRRSPVHVGDRVTVYVPPEAARIL
jgi:tungstate transport system ATP-binding protein